jgi:phage FluMu protein Com
MVERNSAGYNGEFFDCEMSLEIRCDKCRFLNKFEYDGKETFKYLRKKGLLLIQAVLDIQISHCARRSR